MEVEFGLFHQYAQRYYAECHFAQCLGAKKELPT